MKTFNHLGTDLGYDDLLVENGNKGRYYKTPKGNKYASITTILSILSEDFIRAWRARVGEEEANRVSHQASTRGTAVHQLCEDYLNNKEIDYSKYMPNAIAMFKSMQPLLDQHIDNIHAQEIPLYSDFLEAAGRVDCIAEWDGKLSVIDFKTSKAPKEKKSIHAYFMQKTFYAIAYEERTGIPIKQLVTLIGVDHGKPQVFIEDRDNWDKELIQTIKTYYNRKLFGH